MKRLFVVFAAVALVGAFAVSAMAAEWNFFGSARMATFFQDKDETSPAVGWAGLAAGDDDGSVWDLQGNARIGANVKAGDIGGGFEYGTGVNVRKLFGTYNFGGGEILVGQTYSPTCDRFYSNQVWGADEDLLSTGQFYAGRNPMIRLSMSGFDIALVKPNNGGALGIAGGDVDVTFPKVEAKFRFKSEGFFAEIWGGFQTYEIETKAKTYDVTSYVAGIGGGIDAGGAYLKVNGYLGKNLGQYGASHFGVDDATFSTTKNDIVDNDTFGGLAVLGMKIDNNFTVEAGYGYVQHEPDVDNSKKDDTMSYYLNATITIAPGFFVVPEVGIIDYGNNSADADEGKMTYYGAKWQINF